ncbi:MULTISPECIES: hypothetical protein [unclassified Burkholderia]|uniref:hypothetical protein n=1 Tax=unclassified Burkholderia TaxID=2613784 RepID=UPI001F03CA04|nr:MULTISPECIES: hypothetical protein [unclassified Burkholderia]
MLSFIRASVESIRKDAASDRLADGAVIERCLSSLLRHALMTRSPYEIALVQGSAAELMLFPENDVLERCTAAVQRLISRCCATWSGLSGSTEASVAAGMSAGSGSKCNEALEASTHSSQLRKYHVREISPRHTS